MSDEEKDSITLRGQEQERSRFWIPLVIGAVLVVALIAVFEFFGRSPSSRNPSQADPYIAKLQVSRLHLSAAENFAGGSVTYVEGSMVNTGDKKITGTSMELNFKNLLGESVQQETLPVAVVIATTPYVDYG